jgi:hypothetical protein
METTTFVSDWHWSVILATLQRAVGFDGVGGIRICLTDRFAFAWARSSSRLSDAVASSAIVRWHFASACLLSRPIAVGFSSQPPRRASFFLTDSLIAYPIPLADARTNHPQTAQITRELCFTSDSRLIF